MEEVDALKVGQMFVMQYYTQMHRDAQQMVRFYVENSTIVRGGYESGPAEVITGSKVCETFAVRVSSSPVCLYCPCHAFSQSFVVAFVSVI